MNYQFVTDVAEMDLTVIHGFLTECYWCKGIPFDVLEKSVNNSLCFGILGDGEQVAFGRFVTDSATFAYLADVFVLKDHRGQGIGNMMMEKAMALPEVQGLRRLMLATRDAHDLYRPFGFENINDSTLFMQLWRPEIYD